MTSISTPSIQEAMSTTAGNHSKPVPVTEVSSVQPPSGLLNNAPYVMYPAYMPTFASQPMPGVMSHGSALANGAVVGGLSHNSSFNIPPGPGRPPSGPVYLSSGHLPPHVFAALPLPSGHFLTPSTFGLAPGLPGLHTAGPSTHVPVEATAAMRPQVTLPTQNSRPRPVPPSAEEDAVDLSHVKKVPLVSSEQKTAPSRAAAATDLQQARVMIGSPYSVLQGDPSGRYSMTGWPQLGEPMPGYPPLTAMPFSFYENSSGRGGKNMQLPQFLPGSVLHVGHAAQQPAPPTAGTHARYMGEQPSSSMPTSSANVTAVLPSSYAPLRRHTNSSGFEEPEILTAKNDSEDTHYMSDEDEDDDTSRAGHGSHGGATRGTTTAVKPAGETATHSGLPADVEPKASEAEATTPHQAHYPVLSSQQQRAPEAKAAEPSDTFPLLLSEENLQQLSGEQLAEFHSHYQAICNLWMGKEAPETHPQHGPMLPFPIFPGHQQDGGIIYQPNMVPWPHVPTSNGVVPNTGSLFTGVMSGFIPSPNNAPPTSIANSRPTFLYPTNGLLFSSYGSTSPVYPDNLETMSPVSNKAAIPATEESREEQVTVPENKVQTESSSAQPPPLTTTPPVQKRKVGRFQVQILTKPEEPAKVSESTNNAPQEPPTSVASVSAEQAALKPSASPTPPPVENMGRSATTGAVTAMTSGHVSRFRRARIEECWEAWEQNGHSVQDWRSKNPESHLVRIAKNSQRTLLNSEEAAQECPLCLGPVTTQQQSQDEKLDADALLQRHWQCPHKADFNPHLNKDLLPKTELWYNGERHGLAPSGGLDQYGVRHHPLVESTSLQSPLRSCESAGQPRGMNESNGTVLSGTSNGVAMSGQLYHHHHCHATHLMHTETATGNTPSTTQHHKKDSGLAFRRYNSLASSYGEHYHSASSTPPHNTIVTAFECGNMERSVSPLSQESTKGPIGQSGTCFAINSNSSPPPSKAASQSSGSTRPPPGSPRVAVNTDLPPVELLNCVRPDPEGLLVNPALEQLHLSRQRDEMKLEQQTQQQYFHNISGQDASPTKVSAGQPPNNQTEAALQRLEARLAQSLAEMQTTLLACFRKELAATHAHMDYLMGQHLARQRYWQAVLLALRRYVPPEVWQQMGPLLPPPQSQEEAYLLDPRAAAAGGFYAPQSEDPRTVYMGPTAQQTIPRGYIPINGNLPHGMKPPLVKTAPVNGPQPHVPPQMQSQTGGKL